MINVTGFYFDAIKAGETLKVAAYGEPGQVVGIVDANRNYLAVEMVASAKTGENLTTYTLRRA